MSSRGRGFSSRGGSSYRGNRGGGGGGGGGDWGSSGNSGGSMNRGGYSSSRGSRFKYSTPSYDSRTKYGSVGGSEKYSSRGGGRGDHSNSYKRPRDSYSTREDHRSSSESNRKRIRSDSYQQGGGSGGGGSQRYSSSYGGSSTSAQYDENKRSSSSAVYAEKRQSDRGSYHRGEERHSASRNYAPPPPPPPRISDMAAPSTRYGTTSRGRISHGNTSFRGRISSRGGRGFHRVGTRTSESLMTRKRTLTSLDYRRKMLGSRSRDYIQRVRMTTTKLRRSGATTRLTRSKKEPGTGSSVKDKDREMAKAINAEFSDDDKDEDVDSNWGEDEKPHEDDEEEVNTEKKVVKEVKRKKEKQENVKIEEEEKEEDGKEDEEDDKPEEDDEEAEEGENSKAERAARSGQVPSRRDGKRFIKLNCPHCSHRSVTFKEYSLHLYSGRHNSAMRRIAARHKATLARMRVVQRQEQRRVEVRDASRGTLPSITMFCPICKLNYRSLKAMHHLSESHRQMKRFLTPFCRVCRIQFRSPMLFESHVCSLDHIKRKSMADERLTTRNGDAEGDSSGPEEDDKEVNLDNFMTLDSVGDVDAEEEDEAVAATAGEKKKKEKPESAETTNAAAATSTTTTTTTTPATTIATTCTISTAELEKKPKNKQMIKVGLEYIKRVEVQFCELCKVYLPRNESSERAVALHCSTRSHLKRYVRDNDDKALRRQAERIHLQTSTTTSTGASTTNVSGVATAETSKAETNESDATNGANVSTSGSATVALSAEAVNNGNASQTNEEKSVVASETSGGNATQQTAEETNKVNKENNAEEEEEDEEDEFRGDLGDKLWDDVDKDLGDILREAEPGTKSSDDEDSRYDRFRNSEKNSQLPKEKERVEGKLAETQETPASLSPPKKIEAKVKTEMKTEK